MRKAIVLITLALALAGCTLRPYHAPQVAPWTATLPPNTTREPYDARWWTLFDDPVLEELESKAVQTNHDVRIAMARLDEARAAFSDTRLNRFPKANLGASLDKRKEVIPGFTTTPLGVTTYQTGFDAFWELDLFGQVAASVRAAGATADSFEASLDDARVTLAAEVARNYFELRGLQQRLAVADRSLTNQRETLRLTRLRRDAGIGEEFDVASAGARVAAIEAALPPIRTAIAQRQYRLAVLLGRRPGDLDTDLASRAYPVIAKALPLGDADTFLKRRPDIRSAERQLAAASAREGVAAAGLFPRISIAGFLGFVAGRGNLLGQAASKAWAVTPALSWSAFDLGSARTKLRGAEAGTREAEAVYERAVLMALEETETSFVRYGEQQQRLVKLNEQARESARASSIARARYRAGAGDFLSLLDAERTQLQAEDSVAEAESDVFTSIVAVYKALGGISTGGNHEPQETSAR